MLNVMTRNCIATVIACAALAHSVTAAEVEKLTQQPFWQQSAGWWQASSSYFDSNMQPRVAQYHTITRVDVLDHRVVETEYKFFPPSDGSALVSNGKVSAEQGIEIITVSEHRQVGATASVRQESIRPALMQTNGMLTEVVSDRTAIRSVIDDRTGAFHYRMFVDLSAPDTRYVINMGLVSNPDVAEARLGSVRGFAVARGERIAGGAVKAERERLRQVYQVGGIVSADENGVLQTELVESE